MSEPRRLLDRAVKYRSGRGYVHLMASRGILLCGTFVCPDDLLETTLDAVSCPACLKRSKRIARTLEAERD